MSCEDVNVDTLGSVVVGYLSHEAQKFRVPPECSFGESVTVRRFKVAATVVPLRPEETFDAAIEIRRLVAAVLGGGRLESPICLCELVNQGIGCRSSRRSLKESSVLSIRRIKGSAGKTIRR